MASFPGHRNILWQGATWGVKRCSLICWPGGGSLRGVADTFAETPTNGQREQLPGVDVLYLKNVLLKFLDSAAAGRTDQV